VVTQTAIAPATTTVSERLTTKLQLVIPTMHRESHALFAQGDARETYIEWLRVTHAMIRATVPIMATAMDECLHRVDDPVAEGFARYLAKHIREEYGHDTWAAEDYAAAGCDPDDLRELIVGGPVAALVGSQYYWIRHVHPITLLGHMAVIEGYPPSPEMPARLAARTGLPLDAFRAIERHAVVDQRHRVDLYRQIDTLPLRPWHERLLGISALHTAGGLCNLYRSVRLRLAS
jgi:hypothetical protein